MNDTPQQKLEPTPEPPAAADTPDARPTPEQAMQAVQAYLSAHGYALTVVAIGLRSGQPSPLIDYIPTTHRVDFDIVEMRQP